MTTSTSQHTHDASGLAWTAAIAVVWLAVAALRPDTTLHLGPLILPMVAAVLSSPSQSRIATMVAGMGIAAAVIALLSGTGNLDGPTIGPFSSALGESVALLLVGGLISLAIILVDSRRRT